MLTFIQSPQDTNSRSYPHPIVSSPGQGQEGKLLDDLAANIGARRLPGANHQQALLDVAQVQRSSKALRSTFAHVLELLEEEDDEEQGTARPTFYALDFSLKLLSQAHYLVDAAFPEGGAASDGEGGLHVYWRTPTRRVHLSIPAGPAREASIYYQIGSAHATEREVSGHSLAYRLDWMLQG